MRRYLTIGEVSKITGINIRSLRYYDMVGALEPAYVDEKTGYRYYSFDQLQKTMSVKICLESGIALRNLEKYSRDGIMDYSRLISDAREAIHNQIRELENNLEILNYMNMKVELDEHICNDRELEAHLDSHALYVLPYEEDGREFDRISSYVRLANSARKDGYQVSPLYFGLIIRYENQDIRTYIAAGLDGYNSRSCESDNIYHTPGSDYRVATIDEYYPGIAEEKFAELFQLDYDKTVIIKPGPQTGGHEPSYTMYINMPE